MGHDAAAPQVAAYIGIGSNLSDPEGQVRVACDDLAGVSGSRLRACSHLYRTAPVGPQDQPDFVNAVARLDTALSAASLMRELRAIELRHGRVRDGNRWGPRTLDLDLLLYGDAVIDEPGLRVPHPEMANRAFVLVPLADVAPAELVIPGVGAIADLMARCPAGEIARLGIPPAFSCDSAGQLAESREPD
jgi:2-amino-4-hydroxy-6-hydroxymethyldihydropteridine diphosphokinase